MSIVTRRFYLLIALILVIGLFTPGVAPARAQDVKKIVVPNLVGKGDFTSLDAALVADWPSAQITTEEYPTLVRGLETDLNKIQGHMAASWDISKDGLTYTFKLRNNVPWVTWDGKQVAQVMDANGKPMMVTAHDFEYGIKRTLDPRTASQYAYVFTSIIKGAADFNGYKTPVPAGATPDPNTTPDPAVLQKLSDAVGVKATDDSTLVITLSEPASYALNILTITNASAQPQAVIEKFGTKWTEPGNAVSYGPYIVSSWKHDDSLTLTANPFWPGSDAAPKPKIQEILFNLAVDSPGALANYEAGSMDISSVPVTDIDRIKSDPTLGKELTVSPNLSSAYWGYNVTKPPFDDPRVRRAFSMAIDRQSIVDDVTKDGAIPARWFSRPGLAAAPTLENSPDLGITFDVDGAKKELQAYLDEKKITIDQLPPMTVMAYQSDVVVKVTEAMAAMWKENLGVDVKVAVQELKVFFGTLASDPPQIWALGWSADYADTNNFLREVFRSNSGNNFTHWKNATFDKLVDDAAHENDVAKRTELYKQAEEILVKTDAAIIPMYWRSRLTLTKPNITRTFSQTNGDERFEKWDVTAKS